MNGLTAQLALDVLDLEPGQTLAVTGSAGAFGGYVVQLAKAAGLTVVADASPADQQLVEGLGADVVLPRPARPSRPWSGPVLPTRGGWGGRRGVAGWPRTRRRSVMAGPW